MRAMKQNLAHLTFTATFDSSTNVEDALSGRRFSGIAYSGGIAKNHYGSDLAIDIAGLSLPSGAIPILDGHNNDTAAIVGKGIVTATASQIDIVGTLANTDAGNRIRQLASEGIPLQLSVGLYGILIEDFGQAKAIQLNGQTINASAVIRSGTLREVSFTPLGADPATRVEVFSATTVSHIKEEPPMELAELQIQISDLQKNLAAESARAEEAVNKLAEFTALAQLVARNSDIEALETVIGYVLNADEKATLTALPDAVFTVMAGTIKTTASKAKPTLDPILTKEQATAQFHSDATPDLNTLNAQLRAQISTKGA